MTISNWLMILTFTVGSGISQLSATTSTPEPESVRPPTKIAGNCWVNGQWTNPCPDDAPNYPPDRDPLNQQPY